MTSTPSLPVEPRASMPPPGVAILHPDSKAVSRRGIYSYAISLIRAIRQAGHRTALVTDLSSALAHGHRAALHDAIASPAPSGGSSLGALPTYLLHQAGQWQRRSIEIAVDRGIPLNDRNDYLEYVDSFLNLPDFYEICRLAGNKPLLPPVNVDFTFARGHEIAFTATPMAIKARHATVIQTVHDLIILNEKMHELNRGKFLRRLEACVQHADMIVAVSHHTRTELLERYPQAESRTQVIYQPLPANPVHVALSQEVSVQEAALARLGVHGQPFIFFVGALEPRKNTARLIKAFGQSRAFAHCALVLAGPLDEAYAAKEGFEHLLHPSTDPLRAGEVRYVGRISDVEKLCLLRRARLFAFPSITEGFGLPVLEAQSVGCPVLTSNTSALPEVVGDAAVLIDPTDTDAITWAIDAITLDEELNTRLRQTGLANATRFSRDVFAKSLQHLIRQALAR